MNLYKLYHSPLVKLLTDKKMDDKILYHDKNSYSICDIMDNAKNMAKNLKCRGFKEGDRVVIAAEPGIDFISVLYAVIMLKGVTAIIDPDMGSSLYRSRLKQFDPQWIFIDYRLVLLQFHPIIRQLYFRLSKKAFFVPHIQSTKRVIMGKSLKWHGLKYNLKDFKRINNDPIEWECPKESLDFLVTYTSGTLDAPKGVLHTDQSICNSLKLLANKIERYAQCNMVSHLPHFALLGIQANVKVFLWNKSWSPERKIKFIENNDIHIFFGPPVEITELLDYCASTNSRFPKSFKYIILGSAPVYSSFLKRLRKHSNAEIESIYGMTENLLVSSISMEEKLAYEGNGDIVGRPVEGVNVKIEADGEISISSDQLFHRYWHMDNDNKFHPTGDVGFLDKQGRIVLTGRKKNMIIRNEYNLYPGLYEPIINKIPHINQAVMMGRYNEEKADEEVVLFVEYDQELSKKQLMNQLTYGDYEIDHSALPDHIVFTKLPRKGRQQKVDYKALKDRMVEI